MTMQDLPDGVNITQVTLKKIIWDIVPDEQVPDMCNLFGMTGDSPDVSDMEKMAARVRRNNLTPIAQALDGVTNISAVVVERYMRVNGKDPSDYVPDMVKATTIAVLANLIDLDMLHLPHQAMAD